VTSLLKVKAVLKKKLAPESKVALVGIGSELRGDDACGVLIAGELARYARKARPRGFRVFIGETAPENITGEIKKFGPQQILLVDAAEFGEKAGTIKLFSPEEAGGASFCTHQLPLKILADYLTQSLGCIITIIGIQPKKIDFGAPVSDAMRTAVKVVTGAIKEIIEDRQLKSKKGAGKRC
jgi:hydrogenase 3 maturation protease